MSSKTNIKMSLLTIYATAVTVILVIIAVAYMSNNNLHQMEKDQIIENYEIRCNQLETQIEAYEFIKTKTTDLSETVVQLLAINKQLDEDNKSLVESNEELMELRERAELYDKYEYALINESNKRTDITYDQLNTLEELMKKSAIRDEDLLLSFIMVESGGNEKAQSVSSTAKGYGQFLDSTSKFVYTDLLGKSNWDSTVALNGDTCIEMMVAYLDYLYEYNGNDLYKTINSYRGLYSTDYYNKLDYYLSFSNKNIEYLSKNISK